MGRPLVTLALSIALALIYIFLPGIVLFGSEISPALSLTPDIQWALQNAFTQALLSSLFGVMTGALGALALLSLSTYPRTRRAMDLLLLLPSFLPPLFLVLSLLALIEPFPMGNLGVTLAHIFAFSGFVSVLLARHTLSELSQQMEVAYLLGASSFLTFYRVLLPQWRPLLLNFLFLIFVTAFTSFSVPLALGGGKGTNLEVLIYEKIRIENNWQAAFAIGAVQSLFLFLFFWNPQHAPQTMKQSLWQKTVPYQRWLWLSLFCLPSLLLSLAYAQQIAVSLQWTHEFPVSIETIVQLSAHTLWVSLLTGALTLMALVGLIYCFFILKQHTDIWRRLVSPSQAFVAVAMIALFSAREFWSFSWAVAVACTYCALPFLLKLNFIPALKDLQSQFTESARMGASSWQSLTGVILPQIWPNLCFLSGLSAVWASGDFAISSVIGLQSMTLAMKIDSLLGSYRIFPATQLSLLWLFLASLVLYFFMGVFNVFGQKFIQRLWRLQSPYR